MDETLTIRTSNAGRKCSASDECDLLAYWLLERPDEHDVAVCYTHLLHLVSDFADESQMLLSINHLNEIGWIDNPDS